MLELKNVTVSYGPVEALHDVSLHVEEGEVVALLGANGAGKTSLLHAVSGLVPIREGSIEFLGRRLDLVSAPEIVALGVSHCPEGRRVFPDLTIEENLDLGAYLLKDDVKKRENLDQVFRYFLTLAQRRRQMAGTLSGGEQQMLAVGRALMSSPRLLTLDEPSLGLAPMLVDQIFDIIRQINREKNTTILLVEQNANEALLHADRGYVLENGAIIMEGAASELSRNPRVIEAYLGSG
jgi:branched-chain amino acid transport system ATP-binding protein